MRRLLGALVGMMCAIGAGAALAEPDDAERLASAIAPFVDGQTVAIVHIDLGSIDAAESITLLAKLLRLDERGHAHAQGLVAPLGLLPDTGHADVFVVMSLSDLRVGELQGAKDAKPKGLPFFVVVSLAADAPGSAIAVEIKRAMLGTDPRAVAEPVGEAIVVGSPRTLERLRMRPAVNRPEIVQAVRALEGASAHLLLIPPPEARQLVELLWPRLPESLGGGPTKAFTQGVVWAGVGIDLPPAEPELRVVVQSTNQEAAETLEHELSAVAQKLGEQADMRDTVPKFHELWKRLAPRAEGDRLVVTLNEKQASLAEYATLLGVLLRVANAGDLRPK
jgi:hypothetical protein